MWDSPHAMNQPQNHQVVFKPSPHSRLCSSAGWPATFVMAWCWATVCGLNQQKLNGIYSGHSSIEFIIHLYAIDDPLMISFSIAIGVHDGRAGLSTDE